MKKFLTMAVISILALMDLQAFEYNVRMPSTEARPRFSGARVGEWTMDYATARAQATAEGRGLILFTSGSWWCPHCEAFEEKVLVEHATQWKNYIQEKGFYLVMLDFPYRGHVTDDQLWKSKYPELGDGWGFQCWLYDETYLAENGLTREDGLNAIMDAYRIEQSLALDTAKQVTIKTWDGSEDFTYGKVGYPTLIVYLPDGKEAGRFSPSSTNRESDDAYNYVVEKIDSLISEALNEECGLCADPEAWGLTGNKVGYYSGWLTDAVQGIVGTFSVKTSKKDKDGNIKVSASVTVAGKKQSLKGVGQDCCIDTVVLTNGKKEDLRLELMLTDTGLKGTYAMGSNTYSVVGARDVFRQTDAQSKERRQVLTPGTWTFAMSVTNTLSDLSCGYGAFSVSLTKSGSVKLKGSLPDGTSVSVSSKAVIGDSDVFCAPICLDTRKNGFGCCLWFKNGWLFNVSDIRSWTRTSGGTTELGWRPVYTAVAGVGEIAEELEIVLADDLETVGGLPLVTTPAGDLVSVAKNVWKGTADSQFKARMNAKTGLISGTMKFSVLKANGKTKELTGRVSGAVIDGSAYCSVVVGKTEAYQLKVSSCNACED